MAAIQSGKKSQSIRLGFSIILLLVAGWIFLNRNYVLDEIALFQYEPNAEIVAIADKVTLSDKGRRYFYASGPEISDAEKFNEICHTKDEQSIVLGCYTLRKIYIFNVTDERLNGVKEVTAAHEMLHAAYDRLPSSEKQRINRLLKEEVTRIEDPRIKDLIELYNKTEPGQLLNEMHSILPTEVSQLSIELEEYYSLYFKNRGAVVALSKQYESLFANNESRRNQLQTELESLRYQIEAKTVTFNANISQLNADIESFNQQARSGFFASQPEFNQARQKLIDRQRILFSERSSIDELINLFNQKRQELIALNGEVQSLNESLDSTPDDVPNF